MVVDREQLTAYETDIRTTLQAADRASAAAKDLDAQERAVILVLDRKRASLAALDSSMDELEETIEHERPLIHYTDPISVLQFDEKVHRHNQMLVRLRTLNADVNHWADEYNDLVARRDAQTKEINRLIEQANQLSDLYNSTLSRNSR